MKKFEENENGNDNDIAMLVFGCILGGSRARWTGKVLCIQ